MFELTLANWPVISRTLYENVNEWFILVAIIHKITIGFAVVGVINGVFIQETFTIASLDDDTMVMQRERQVQMHAQKMRLLFEQADESGDGFLTFAEFQKVAEDPRIGSWLSAMGLDLNNATLAFELMDDGDDEISFCEFLTGIMRLKNSSKGVDLATVLYENKKLLKRVLAVGNQVDALKKVLHSRR